MTEVWELSYFGQGGFPYEQVWNMPVTSRKFFLKKIEKYQEALQQAVNEHDNIITENTDPNSIKKIEIPPHLVPRAQEPSYVSKVKTKQ